MHRALAPLAIAFVVVELVIGLAHTGARLARAPAALARGWPATSELDRYRWLEPYARGRAELGLVLAGTELGTGSATDLARYRAQNAIAPTRLVLEPRAVSLALVGPDRAAAERELAARGYGFVRFDPTLPFALVGERPLEPAASPPPLPARAPLWRLGATALAALVPLAFAARRGGQATAFLVLALAPGLLALCAAATDASGVPEGLRTPGLWLLWPLALLGVARIVPALEPRAAHPHRAALAGAWRAALAACAVLGALALALRIGEQIDGGWDAQAMYATRARTIALAPGFLEPFADFPGARELHPDYPPLVPFALAGGFRLAGGASPAVAIALQLAFAVGFAGLCLRWALARGGALLAMGALGLTALAPFWHDRIAGQECDVPTGALFGVAVLVWLWRFPERDARDDARHALAAGLALALAALTKNEGLFFALFLGGALGLDALRRGAAGRGTLVALSAVLAAALLLLALFARVVPPNDLVQAFDPARASWARAVRVARAFARPALRPQDLRLLPPLVLPFAAVLVARGLAALRAGRRDALVAEAALAATLALVTGVFFVAYLTTPWDLDWHLGTSLVRLCAQLWPGLVVLALALAARGLERRAPRAAA